MEDREWCGRCRFYGMLDDGDDGGEQYGHCRRYPPVILTLGVMQLRGLANDGYDTDFPIVGPGDWCGEFQPEKPDDANP